ncbi:10841_t:CDS:1, partial [Gigaspora margarita]
MSYQNFNFINEIFPINSRNQLNNILLLVPVINVPFPPIVDIENLISRPRNRRKNIKPRTKPPNAFLIYRMQYVKELYAKNQKLPMRTVSSTIAKSWRKEPNHVVEHYEKIAEDASKLFNQKFLKPPTPQKVPARRNSQQRTINKHA